MRKWFWRIYLCLLIAIPLGCTKKCDDFHAKMSNLFIDKYGTCPNNVYQMHIHIGEGKVTATISCPGDTNENTKKTFQEQWGGQLRVLYGEFHRVL